MSFSSLGDCWQKWGLYGSFREGEARRLMQSLGRALGDSDNEGS